MRVFRVAIMVALLVVSLPALPAFAADAVAFCDINNTGRSDLTQEFGRRISIPQDALSRLKIFGGRCEVHLPGKSDIMLDSSTGVIFVDGNRVGNGNGMLFQGTAVGIEYPARDGSAGFALVWSPIGGNNKPPVSPPAPGPANPAGSCTPKGGQQVNLQWAPDKNRLFIAESDMNALKSANQSMMVDCHVQAGTSGGVLHALGQDIQLSGGQSWIYTYRVKDPSLGFDFIANGQPATSGDSQGSGAVVPGNGDNPAVPAGSCTPQGGQQVSLTWAPDKGRLYMTEQAFNSLKSANASATVDCHVQAGQRAGTLHALGKDIGLDAGGHWFYTFIKSDPSFGFDFVQN